METSHAHQFLTGSSSVLLGLHTLRNCRPSVAELSGDAPSTPAGLFRHAWLGGAMAHLMDVLGRVLCDLPLQAAVPVAQVHRRPNIPAPPPDI